MNGRESDRMNRKTFFAGSAAAAALVGSAVSPAAAQSAENGSPARPFAPVLLRGHYDYAAMMRVLDNPAAHKQLFLSNPDLLGAPGAPATFIRMVNAWNAYEFALEVAPKRARLAVAAVLISRPVVFALNDKMWAKYRIAQTFNVVDRTGAPARGNPTRTAWGPLDPAADPNDTSGMYHDYSSDALRARGARFLVCHNAIGGVSAGFVKASGVAHADIVADWTANVLPGFTVVPAGGMVVQLAQDRGWKLYPVTD